MQKQSTCYIPKKKKESANQDILDCSNGLRSLICSKHAGCSFKKFMTRQGNFKGENQIK
jgi:hypothetical protein